MFDLRNLIFNSSISHLCKPLTRVRYHHTQANLVFLNVQENPIFIFIRANKGFPKLKKRKEILLKHFSHPLWNWPITGSTSNPVQPCCLSNKREFVFNKKSSAPASTKNPPLTCPLKMNSSRNSSCCVFQVGGV